MKYQLLPVFVILRHFESFRAIMWWLVPGKQWILRTKSQMTWNVLQQDMTKGHFTDTRMGLRFLTRNVGMDVPETPTSCGCVDRNREGSFFVLLKCYETGQKSNVDLELCVDSLLGSQYRSHAKERD